MQSPTSAAMSGEIPQSDFNPNFGLYLNTACNDIIWLRELQKQTNPTRVSKKRYSKHRLRKFCTVEDYLKMKRQTAHTKTQFLASAWPPSTGHRCYTQREVQLLLTALACRAWTLSCHLHRASLHVPTTKSSIESYANRLEDHSTLFLYIYRRLRSHMIETGGTNLDYHLALYRFKVCCRLLQPFQALCQAVELGTRSSKDESPIIEVKLPHGGGNFTIDPFTKTGYENFEDSLDQIEECASEAIFWIRRITGPPLDHDVELDGQVFMKLAWKPPNTYFAFRFPIIKHVDYTVKSKKIGQKVDYPFSIAERTNSRGWDLPLYVQPSKSMSNSENKAGRRIPDFSSLERRNYEEDLGFKSTPGKLRTRGNKIACRKLKEQGRIGDLSCGIFLPDSLSPELFRSVNDKASAGEVLLSDDLWIACEYGRPKKLTAVLFETRLVILRNKTSQSHVQYDIPVEYLLQVTHRNGEPGSAVLTVFWDAEPDGPHEVAGAELFFDDTDKMMLWAGYLAQALVQ